MAKAKPAMIIDNMGDTHVIVPCGKSNLKGVGKRTLYYDAEHLTNWMRAYGQWCEVQRMNWTGFEYITNTSLRFAPLN